MVVLVILVAFCAVFVVPPNTFADTEGSSGPSSSSDSLIFVLGLTAAVALMVYLYFYLRTKPSEQSDKKSLDSSHKVADGADFVKNQPSEKYMTFKTTAKSEKTPFNLFQVQF